MTKEVKTLHHSLKCAYFKDHPHPQEQKLACSLQFRMRSKEPSPVSARCVDPAQ
jgi:hypothetical protein